MVDGHDFRRSLQNITWADGGHEAERLRKVDGAVAGKLRSIDRRDQAGGQHTVGDTACEDGIAGNLLV